MQYNLNVQREIVPNLTFLIGYVGSHGVHGITQTDDVNIVLPVKELNGTYLGPAGHSPRMAQAGRISTTALAWVSAPR